MAHSSDAWESIGRIFRLVRSNIERAVAGQPVESVVNGLDPVMVRRRVPA